MTTSSNKAAILKALGKSKAGAFSAVAPDHKLRVIPTGSAVMDRYILGCGGLPVGRFVELFGDESTGKTSLMLQWLAAAQKAGGTAVLMETEKTFDPTRISMFGVNEDEAILLWPDSVEEAIGELLAVLDALPDNPGGPGNLVAWDTLAATNLEIMLDGKVKVTKDKISHEAKGTTGVMSRKLSEYIKLIGVKAARTGTTIILGNQTRDNIGVMFGSPTVSPGGKAKAFHASARIQIWAGKPFLRNGQPAGICPTVKAVKNKVGIPGRKAKLRLDWERGWDDGWSTLELAKELKLVKSRARNVAEARAALGWPAVDDAPEVEPDDAEADEELNEKLGIESWEE